MSSYSYGLSLQLNAEIENRISNDIATSNSIDALSIEILSALQDEKTSRISVDDILSNAVLSNSEQIIDIWNTIRGGLNYSGILCIDIPVGTTIEVPFGPGSYTYMGDSISNLL